MTCARGRQRRLNQQLKERELKIALDLANDDREFRDKRPEVKVKPGKHTDGGLLLTNNLTAPEMEKTLRLKIMIMNKVEESKAQRCTGNWLKRAESSKLRLERTMHMGFVAALQVAELIVGWQRAVLVMDPTVQKEEILAEQAEEKRQSALDAKDRFEKWLNTQLHGWEDRILSKNSEKSGLEASLENWIDFKSEEKRQKEYPRGKDKDKEEKIKIDATYAVNTWKAFTLQRKYVRELKVNLEYEIQMLKDWKKTFNTILKTNLCPLTNDMNRTEELLAMPWADKGNMHMFCSQKSWALQRPVETVQQIIRQMLTPLNMLHKNVRICLLALRCCTLHMLAHYKCITLLTVLCCATQGFVHSDICTTNFVMQNGIWKLIEYVAASALLAHCVYCVQFRSCL